MSEEIRAGCRPIKSSGLRLLWNTLTLPGFLPISLSLGTVSIP